MIENGAVLPMLYLPPVAYFSKLNQFKPNIIIEQEEQERINDAFARILENACVERPDSPFVIVNSLESVKQAFVFGIVCNFAFGTERALHLKTSYDEVERVDGQIGDGGSDGAGKGVAESWECWC